MPIRAGSLQSLLFRPSDNREGMGKRAFLPQGVRDARLFFFYQTRQAFTGIMGWPGLQPKACPNSSMFCTTPSTRNWRGE